MSDVTAQGLVRASGGQSQNPDTPTSLSWSPRAYTISVPDGKSDTILLLLLLVLLLLLLLLLLVVMGQLPTSPGWQKLHWMACSVPLQPLLPLLPTVLMCTLPLLQHLSTKAAAR
jgi:hypothetical protein